MNVMKNKVWLKSYPKDYKSEIFFDEEESFFDYLYQTNLDFDNNNPAVTCLDRTLSYSELWDEVNIMVTFLKRRFGLKKGSIISIMLPNSIQFIVTYLACLKIGAIINTINPLYTERELEYQLKDSQSRTIIILDFMIGKLDNVIKKTKINSVIVVSLSDYMPFWKRPLFFQIMKKQGNIVPKVYNFEYDLYREIILKVKDLALFPKININLDDTVLLQYTGGTTGVPKGAELTHRNLISNIKQIENVLESNLEYGKEIMLGILPLYHIFAMSTSFFAMIKIRAHIVLLPKPIPLDVTVKAIKKYKPTAFVGINTLFNGLNQREDFKSIQNYSFKCVVAGGMTLQKAVADEWFRITGSKIKEGYGLTEASPVTHINPLQIDPKENSIGLPVASTLAKIVNEKGLEVKVGEIGELIVSGPQIMKGYWNKKEETEKIIQDGWLYTGDLAYMDNKGYFFIVDRKKDMIIVSGFNVYPTEIEQVLVEIPDILEAGVIGIPSDKTGETIKAYLVAKEGKTLDIEEIKKYCYQHLSRYKVPKEFEIISELPKTNVGKILRRELRNL